MGCLIAFIGLIVLFFHPLIGIGILLVAMIFSNTENSFYVADRISNPPKPYEPPPPKYILGRDSRGRFRPIHEATHPFYPETDPDPPIRLVRDRNGYRPARPTGQIWLRVSLPQLRCSLLSFLPTVLS
jgi:hypothetical protein